MELSNRKDGKYAVIDMGTNTFHLLIAEVTKGELLFLHKEKVGVKLGQGSINQGYISEGAMERGLNCLNSFAQTIITFEVPKKNIVATATSAVRSASNGVQFAELIQENTGITVSIIGGELEARLIYEGVKAAIGIKEEPILIMDIGGGSVEFIIAKGNDILYKNSLEIGGQRLMDRFMESDPISIAAIDALNTYLAEQLTSVFEAINKHQPKTLVGSSGTFDTICEIYWKKENLDFKLDALKQFQLPLSEYYPIASELLTLNKEERLALPGMAALRADMIVVAVCLINFIFKNTGLENLLVSTYALKEGVLMAAIEGKSLNSFQ